jgi:ADP-ribose pyrophosphatase YjhB (NUDIX family)
MDIYRQSCLLVVAALIRRGEEVLLVEQQWPDAPAPAWSLPGGRVEANEALTEALIREVHEETGLTVINPGRLLYTLQYHNPIKGTQSLNFVFDVAEWAGELQVADPDNFILRAEFYPPPQAIETLENHLPWRVMREPIVAHLRGAAQPGTVWVYRRQGEGGEALIAPLNGLERMKT